MSTLHFRKTYEDFFEFASTASGELVILSPYIKLDSLRQLLGGVRKDVKVIVVARWRIGDLVFGSSDIEVYKYLKSLGHSFYINREIHLKVIVKDKKEILLGSANITGSGLGLFERSNIEAVAIDALDEKYLPEIYSIVRESVLVDDELLNKINQELESHLDLKKERSELEAKWESIEKTIFKKTKKYVLVHDFILTTSPEACLKAVELKDFNESVVHDLRILGLKKESVTLDSLKDAFLTSVPYIWQKENIRDEVLFGKYSEILHNSVVDNPRPYRKLIKELVANMFSWTEYFSDDYLVKKYNRTKSLIQK